MLLMMKASNLMME